MSERAFIHLQRSIAVDEQLRTRWQTAFTTHETACERLGSVHLLLHGIWAFKLNAEKARTDLMFEEPLPPAGKIEKAATGLVLTEWKRCLKGDGRDEFEEAVRQCKEYSTGPLGGFELRSHRYAVVVSNDRLTEPPDIVEGPTRYRHINIAVNPSTPSKPARSA